MVVEARPREQMQSANVVGVKMRNDNVTYLGGVDSGREELGVGTVDLGDRCDPSIEFVRPITGCLGEAPAIAGVHEDPSFPGVPAGEKDGMKLGAPP